MSSSRWNNGQVLSAPDARGPSLHKGHNQALPAPWPLLSLRGEFFDHGFLELFSIHSGAFGGIHENVVAAGGGSLIRRIQQADFEASLQSSASSGEIGPSGHITSPFKKFELATCLDVFSLRCLRRNFYWSLKDEENQLQSVFFCNRTGCCPKPFLMGARTKRGRPLQIEVRRLPWC
jgi:hypothetical protein